MEFTITRLTKVSLINVLSQAFFGRPRKKLKGKNSSFEKTQANFPKKLKKFSKNSQIRQLPPEVVASEIFTDENSKKKLVLSLKIDLFA